MTRAEPYRAVIADMDGVLTQTASVHERAWKQTFDALLADYADERPFSSDDYRAYVDGKPRYDGVADFLAARGIDLPRGAPADEPGNRTVYGIGNRKNARFLELLAREGAEVYQDALAALRRWRRGGLRLAVVSASRNCRAVLRAAGIEDRFDAIVEGQLAAELGLAGKAAMMREAARRVQVDPQDAVVLEDATAGVRAAREAGCGCVVGIDRTGRTGHGEVLRHAGAEQVVTAVSQARFLRRIPSALAHFDALLEIQGDRELAVVFDDDGTLTPIVADSKKAELSHDMRARLLALCENMLVTIVSGRDRADVQERVDVDGLVYAGRHGLDIAGAGFAEVLELEPNAPWDKGRALQWIMHVLGIDPQRTLALYLGDDETDEDAFAVLAASGLGIWVGEELSTSLADYRVANLAEVGELLGRLVGMV